MQLTHRTESPEQPAYGPAHSCSCVWLCHLHGLACKLWPGRAVLLVRDLSKFPACRHACMHIRTHRQVNNVQVLLAYQLDTRPKVRKRAQAGVQAVLGAVWEGPASAPASEALLKCAPCMLGQLSRRPAQL